MVSRNDRFPQRESSRFFNLAGELPSCTTLYYIYTCVIFCQISRFSTDVFLSQVKPSRRISFIWGGQNSFGSTVSCSRLCLSFQARFFFSFSVWWLMGWPAVLGGHSAHSERERKNRVELLLLLTVPGWPTSRPSINSAIAAPHPQVRPGPSSYLRSGAPHRIHRSGHPLCVGA